MLEDGVRHLLPLNKFMKGRQLMGRKPRIYFEGAIYHVIQRGNNKSFIYEKQMDKTKLLELVNETMHLEGYEFNLMYFVIMDNHYHLVVETPNALANVSHIFKRINMLYTRYYNKIYGRCGGLYGGRPSIILIEDTRQLMQTFRYIANNPVRAGIVSSPEKYEWSAYSLMNEFGNGIIESQLSLSRLHINSVKSIGIYNSLVQREYSENIVSKLRKTEFDLLKSYGDPQLDKLSSLLWQFGQGDEEILSRICSGVRDPKIAALKKQFITCAHNSGYDKQSIAKLLNMTRRGVDYVLARNVEGGV